MNLQTILKYPVVFLAGLFSTLVLTMLLTRVSHKIGLMAIPGDRHVHDRPIPNSGGIAVFVGFHVSCALVFLPGWLPFQGTLDISWWWQFMIVSFLLLVVGIVDDMRSIRPLEKLSGQVVVAFVAFMMGMRIENLLGVDLPPAVDLVITVLWFVGIVNAFNLIDGMDGLATGLAAIGAIGIGGGLLFRRSPGDALVLLGLVGACIGFLRFNFHPATCFLGDSGSMFLGFTLASVAISTGSKSTMVTAIGVPLLAVGVPIFDAILAVWRRTVRRYFLIAENGNGRESNHVFNADMDHLHHRLIRSGLSQRRVATCLYVINGCLVGLGLLLLADDVHTGSIFLVAFVVALYVIIKHLARIELWDSGKAISDGLQRPGGSVMWVIVAPMTDVVILAITFASAVHIATPQMSLDDFKTVCFDQMPFWVIAPFLSLSFAKTYQRVWNKARVSEYAIVAVALGSGLLLAAGLSSAFGYAPLREMAAVILIDGAVAGVLVVGLRAFPRILQDSIASMRRDHDTHTVAKNILVYGAGFRCTLYLRSLSFEAVSNHEQTHIVGALDDDRSLQGRLVHGCPVLGGIANVGAIIERYRVNEIVVVARLTPARRERLLKAAREAQIPVLEWRTELRPLE